MSTSSIWSAAAHHRVRHRLLLGHAGDPLDDVVERLEVLEVDRRDDVDAGVEEVLDVLPALGVAGAGDVGVGQLVDQDQVGPPGQQAVDVHLLERLAPVLDPPAGEDRQVADLGVGLGTPVRPRPSRSPRRCRAPCGATLVEHGERLADAGRRPQVEPKLPPCHATP